MLDYTRLVEQLVPVAGGEDPARLRAMMVAGVNSDGTVDLVTSGVVIPDVPRLSGAVALVGSPVQVLVHRGAMLVIGAAASTAGHGWRHVTSGSAAGQSSVSIPVPSGVYSQLRLTVVGARASGSGNGEIWCRLNNLSTSIYQTGRANTNPSSGVVANNYHDTHTGGFLMAFWTATSTDSLLGSAVGLFLNTDDAGTEVAFQGHYSRTGSTPNVGISNGRTTSNVAVSSLQLRTEGAVDFSSGSRYWLEGYIG